MEQSSRNFQPFSSYRNCMAIFFLFQKMFYRIHSLGSNERNLLNAFQFWSIIYFTETEISSRKHQAAHRHPPQDDCGLPTITIRSEFLYLHPLKTILLLRNCLRPPHLKHSLKAWSNVASNLTRTVIWCVDKIWTSWIIVVYYMDNSTSNNIQSQDGNSRITSKN